MPDSTPSAMLFGLRVILRVASGPVLLGGALTLGAAIALQLLAGG